jgi:acyl carrier protein
VKRPPIAVPLPAAPDKPTVVVASRSNGPQTSTAVAAPSRSKVAASVSEASNGSAPTPEAFREALLHAVSARTGYPVDVLDETVPLEAGLGIDSIKTVEIFSNLKEYHKYFQSEDASEEDLLEQFSKLKTLQDIVRFYEQRRADITATPHAASERHAGTGSSTETVHVQRMTLTAADAPLETGNGKKKTSRKSS